MKNNFKKIITTTSILSFALLGSIAIANLNQNQNDLNAEVTPIVSKAKSDDSIRVKDIEATTYNVLVSTIESDGEHLYAWGENSHKIVASANDYINAQTEIILPAEIELDGWNSSWKIQEIELNERYAATLVLDSYGQQHLYMWGDNRFESSAEESRDFVNLIYGSEYESKLIDKPVEVDISMLNGQEISNIELTRDAGMIITSDAETDHIYTWGDTYYGAVGNGATTGIVATPTEITLPGLEDKGFFVDDVEGYMPSFSTGWTPSSLYLMSAHDEDGKYYLYQWGSAYTGISGIVTEEPDPENPGSTIEVPVSKLYEPTLIAGNLDGKITEVDFGQDTEAVIYDDGTNQSIYQWGLDYTGAVFNELDDKLNGTKIPFNTPVITYTTAGTEWTEIKNLAFSSHKVNFQVSNSTDSEIVGWGSNYGGVFLQETTDLSVKYNAIYVNTGLDLSKLTIFETVNDVAFAVVNGDLYSWGADKSDGNNGSYLKGTETVLDEEYGYSIPAKVQFDFDTNTDDNNSIGYWWILFITLSIIALLIMAWIWYEFHEDHKEKHEHHWFHIGRHHE